MDYTEVTISTTTRGAEIVSDILLRLGAAGTQILDRADLPDPNKPTANWELMDQSVIDAMPEDVQVKAWFDEARLKGIIGSLREQLALAKNPDMGTLNLTLQGVKEEDWAENWKQYYKPFRIGAHMVVKPTWESWDAQPGDLIIEIDPGMAFGTGTHETTAMCVGLIEKYYRGGTLLDVGNGSGILAKVHYQGFAGIQLHLLSILVGTLDNHLAVLHIFLFLRLHGVRGAFPDVNLNGP